MLPLYPPGGAPPGAMPPPQDPAVMAPPAQAPGLGPVPLPPVPAAQAGMAAAALVPQQEAAQQALQVAQGKEVLAALLSSFAQQPNPVAEAAQGEPAGMITGPDAGGGVPGGEQLNGGY